MRLTLIMRLILETRARNARDARDVHVLRGGRLGTGLASHKGMSATDRMALESYLADILSLVKNEDTRYRMEQRITRKWMENRAKERAVTLIDNSGEADPVALLALMNERTGLVR